MSGMRRVVAIGVAAAAVVVIALHAAIDGPVSRAAVSAGPFVITGVFDPAGDPEPAVGEYPDGTAASIHWSLCPPGAPGACRPIPSTDGAAHPGPQPAGTVFRFTGTYRGHTYADSETWDGAVRAVSAPLLHGPPRFRARVTGSAATWAGGWGTETDQLGLEACPTRRGTRCVMLSGDELQCARNGVCGSIGGVVGPVRRPNRARIGNWYTGWYLFALDARLGPGLSDLVGFGSPAAIPPWPIRATVVRSRAYGPVSGPPPPRLRFSPRARVRGQRVTVASVHCAVRCHAWVTVSLIRRHFTSGERVSWGASSVFTGRRMLTVRGPIPPGPVEVTINVGDGPYVHARAIVP